jgi:hypothetical protein
MGCCNSTLKKEDILFEDVSVPLLIKSALSDKADILFVKDADTSPKKEEMVIREYSFYPGQLLRIKTHVNLTGAECRYIMHLIHKFHKHEYSGVQYSGVQEVRQGDN